jgi:anti-anti-sigma regulatory factor
MQFELIQKQFELIQKEAESILIVNGELTLPYAAQFKDELMLALNSAQRIVIDTQGLSDIDLSGFQLICAAHQCALASGKELLLGSDPAEVVQRKRLQAGLANGNLCGREANLECIWNGGDR